MAEKQERDKNSSFSSAKAITLEDLSNSTDVQWVRIALDKLVIATGDRAWLYQPSSTRSYNYFAQPMDSAGSVAATRNLLDGAIAAARYAVSSNVRPPALTPSRWVWRLAGAYHLCHPTPRLMKRSAQYFAAAKRWRLAHWAARKAREETGHDRLALFDIQSLGYDPEAVVKTLFPPAAKALLDYFTRSAQDVDPIDCVGYSYTMERLAMGIKEEYIQKVEILLPPGIDATRCLREHSSVGADVEHVEETIEMVAGLTPSERTRIAIACYETALLCFSPPSEGYVSDKELQKILRPMRLRKSLLAKLVRHSHAQ